METKYIAYVQNELTDEVVRHLETYSATTAYCNYADMCKNLRRYDIAYLQRLVERDVGEVIEQIDETTYHDMEQKTARILTEPEELRMSVAPKVERRYFWKVEYRNGGDPQLTFRHRWFYSEQEARDFAQQDNIIVFDIRMHPKKGKWVAEVVREIEQAV